MEHGNRGLKNLQNERLFISDACKAQNIFHQNKYAIMFLIVLIFLTNVYAKTFFLTKEQFATTYASEKVTTLRLRFCVL